MSSKPYTLIYEYNGIRVEDLVKIKKEHMDIFCEMNTAWGPYSPYAKITKIVKYRNGVVMFRGIRVFLTVDDRKKYKESGSWLDGTQFQADGDDFDLAMTILNKWREMFNGNL